MSKVCKQCGERKELPEYYRRSATADGYFGKCKVCVSADARARRQNPLVRDRLLAQDREAHRKWREANPFKVAEGVRQYQRNNKEKVRAWNMVARNLEAPDACSECGSTSRIHAHHDDYSRPLDVRWLCSACHKQHHAKAG
jgi:ribosomal protein S27AE